MTVTAINALENRAIRSAEPARRKRPPGGGSAGTFSTARKASVQRPAAALKTTKTEQVLVLLRRSKGASIADLSNATGWQAHSVRGFLSGTVKKKMGLAVVSEKDTKGVRRYRIAKDAAA
jgi:hypothetical protein